MIIIQAEGKMIQSLCLLYVMFFILGDKWIFMTLLLHSINGMLYKNVIFTEELKIEYICRSITDWKDDRESTQNFRKSIYIICKTPYLFYRYIKIFFSKKLKRIVVMIVLPIRTWYSLNVYALKHRWLKVSAVPVLLRLAPGSVVDGDSCGLSLCLSSS